MIIKIEYITNEDRQNILESNKDKYLVEEQNVIEGNFLIFNSEKPLIEQITSLENELTMTNALLLDFMESMMGGI